MPEHITKHLQGRVSHEFPKKSHGSKGRITELSSDIWMNLIIFHYDLHQMDPGIAYIYGGCRKFLLLFGRIGPLALRPCALLRAWGFLSHSINILQIPLWYGDMMWWCVLRSPLRPLARPCIFDASISCSQNPISPEDVIERTGFFINPHIYTYLYVISCNIYNVFVLSKDHVYIFSATKSGWIPSSRYFEGKGVHSFLQIHGGIGKHHLFATHTHSRNGGNDGEWVPGKPTRQVDVESL